MVACGCRGPVGCSLPPVRFLSKRRCSVCDGPLTVHQEVQGGICDKPACRRARIDRARTGRALAALEEADPGPDRVPFVTVPADVAVLGNLAQKRVRRFRDHLNEVVSRAFTPGFVPEPYSPTLLPTARESRVLAAACGVCQGHCCATGRTHAWVDEDAIAHARALVPGIRPARVVEVYLEHLPHVHAVGSCVFQTRLGCALPTTLRGSVCNGYFCPGLIALCGLLRGGARRVFVVAMDGLRVVRTGFVDATR